MEREDEFYKYYLMSWFGVSIFMIFLGCFREDGFFDKFLCFINILMFFSVWKSLFLIYFIIVIYKEREGWVIRNRYGKE